MKATLLRNIVAFGILLGGLNTTTLTQAHAADPGAGVEKKAAAGHRPFRGKVDQFDKTNRSIKVGTRTFHVIDTTKIIKAGKPSTIDDVTVGDTVGGAYRNADGGKLELVTLRLGPKSDKDEPARADRDPEKGSGKENGKAKEKDKEKKSSAE